MLRERNFLDGNRAILVASGVTGSLFYIKDLASAQPIERLLKQPHCQMTDRLFCRPLPAQGAALDMPEDVGIRLLHPHSLVRMLVE